MQPVHGTSSMVWRLQPLRAQSLWSVDAVVKNLRKRKLENHTIERIYEADVYPGVMDFASWRQHRQRRRYLEHLITMFRSVGVHGGSPASL